VSLSTRISQRLAQKAISHRPDLRYREHVWRSWSGEQNADELSGYSDYAKVYGVYVWVHKAVAKIAENFAPLPLRVVNTDGEPLPEHVLTRLFAYVNDRMSAIDLWQQWCVHMLLGGESFLELVPNSRGEPVEVWPRRPDKVGVIPDKARPLYPAPAGYTFGEETYKPEEMIHALFYNPLNPWRGLAPISAVRHGIIIDIFAQAWSKAFLKRGARPDYALIAPQGITPGEREELENRLTDKFGGADNWHKPIVLEEGITDIKPFSFPPKDIEWLDQRRMSRDEVGALFGVPDEIMGWGRDTYENFAQALKVFWTLTLKPLALRRDTVLTSFFTRTRPMLKPGERIATDFSGVGVLQEEITPKAEVATKLWSLGVPFNTLDKRLGLGVGPVTGGDVAYVPMGMLSVGSAPTIEGDGKTAVTRQVVKDADTTWAYGSPRHVATWKRFVARTEPLVQAMRRQLKKDFQRQQLEALRVLREGKAADWAEKIKLIDSDDERRKQEGWIPVTPDDLLDWASEDEALAEFYRRFFTDMIRIAGAGTLDDLASAIDFNLRDPLVAEAIKTMPIRFAKDINETTQSRIADELRRILLEADEGGWDTARVQREIHDRISEVFNVRKSDTETERIARTEMGKAANKGTLEGYRQSGVVEKKRWLAALDDRTRDAHAEAHGQVVPLNSDFEVGGERLSYPGDPKGSLENIINCRCTTAPVVLEKPRPAATEPAPSPTEPRRFASQDEANEWLSEQNGINPPLSDEENEALKWYKEDGFYDLNSDLRDAGYSEDDRVEIIDAALDKSRLAEPVITYRGADWSVFEEENLIGATIEDQAFVSTSLSERVATAHADGVIIEIRVPAGTRALNMERWQVAGWQRGESELLLPRNSKFKVISDDIDEEPDIRRLVVELIL